MSENNIPVLQVWVFPESGHHYSFAPFTPKVLTEHPTLRILCEQDKVPWRVLNHSWLRGRFGMNEGRHGMWICLESNLGDITRGYICDPHRPYHPEEAAAHDPLNPTPYAALNPSRLPEQIDAIPIVVPMDGKEITVVKLEIIWQKPAAVPREVDIIVDFGNTRTVVLALEHNQANAGKLSTLCHNVRFMRRGGEFAKFNGADDSCAIADSWFILQEPMFADFESPNDGFNSSTEITRSETQTAGGFLRSGRVEVSYTGIKRIPQMFVELAPAVMGDSAREILANLDLREGGNYTLSSPKRYAWDDDSLTVSGRTHWCMYRNRFNSRPRPPGELPGLKGAVLQFMPLDRREWEINSPPNEDPDIARRPTTAPDQATYPRADAMIWAALGILELAHRQITSEAWRAGNDPYVPRILRRILVTYPAGWTGHETEVYRSKWRKAIDIFTLGHLVDRRPISEGGNRPELVMDLDEAVASQLPIIYSEILALGNKGHNWIELLGSGSGTNAKVRVMTVDIGGGTTDISIIEYRDDLDGGGVDLEARLLFRDSSTTAGDNLAKAVIETVLLPALGSRFHGDDSQTFEFENLFKSPPKGVAEVAMWSRIVKLVFLPIVRQWFKDFSEGRSASADGTRWSPDRIMGSEGRLVDPGALREFNAICHAKLGVDVMPDEEPIFHDSEKIKECVDEVFRPLVQSLAKYVAAFGVDMITLSGKPSELPQVKKILDECLPILPQRIIQAKNYPAGSWFPMSSNGCISDAKTVTAVGAALYQAIQKALVHDWNIRRVGDGQAFPYYWGKMPTDSCPWKFDPLYLDPYLQSEGDETNLPGCNRITTVMQIGTCIGRKILPSAAKPEQVYRLRWKDAKRADAAGFGANLSVVVTLARSTDDPTALLPLGPGDYRSRDDRDLSLSGGLELQACSLEKEEFWVDSGRFDVVWPH